VVRALVVGEALVDVTRRVDGTVAEHPGGSPLNVAVTLARLGVPTCLAAQVGDDRLGALVRAHLEASGVTLLDVGGSGPTASATATLDADGAATYDFDLRWDPASLPDPAGFDVVHVGSIGSWTAPGAAAVAALAGQAQAAGVPVAFDPNVRPSLTPERDVLREHVLGLAALSRFVKLSDEDAAVLLPPDADPEAALDLLAAEGARLVALTRGGHPAVLRSGGVRVEVPVPGTPVVDTIGAGDTWMGAMLAGLLQRGWTGRPSYGSEQLTAVGRHAVAAAAITCSRPGADPPWADEMPVHEHTDGT
jgi:fructokinase